ncbi:MAG TPA: zf-HC2 domain-containing protein [Pyrinomonadaceae bacterium]|nr:zf-HC2 domain-containing protein [Pyrinomonadaceae bacterium]
MLDNEHHERELIVPYLEGELDAISVSLLEEHLKECSECRGEVQLQRLLLCELDAAFSGPPKLEVPEDFARIVAAQAESDMSGARTGTERNRALQFSVLLGLSSFALIGITASKSLFAAGQIFSAKVLFVAGLLGRALYDAGAGLAVILRVAGGVLLPDAFSVLVLLLLLLAVMLLTILISAYHRYPRRGLSE